MDWWYCRLVKIQHEHFEVEPFAAYIVFKFFLLSRTFIGQIISVQSISDDRSVFAPNNNVLVAESVFPFGAIICSTQLKSLSVAFVWKGQVYTCRFVCGTSLHAKFSTGASYSAPSYVSQTYSVLAHTPHSSMCTSTYMYGTFTFNLEWGKLI